MISFIILVVAATIGYLVYKGYLFSAYKAVYPSNMVKMLNEERFSKISNITNKLAIVTGSTNGLGKSISIELYRLGYHVILASRNAIKCKNVQLEITKMNIESQGSVICLMLDVSDFDSVRSFSEEVINTYQTVDILVNNAGIHYAADIIKNITHMSAQGYDLSFATNYMGHFLLTELLVPHMETEGRVVNIASLYHYQGGEHFLNPNSDLPGNMPLAASANYTLHHHYLAYGNSKLAQILHTKELQKRLIRNGNHKLLVTSACPGWVKTEMTSLIPHVKLFFTPEAGILSSMCAILSTQKVSGGELFTNYIVPFEFNGNLRKFIYYLKRFGMLGDFFVDVFAQVILAVQGNSYGQCHREAMSVDSDNEQLASDLYDWTTKTFQNLGYL